MNPSDPEDPDLFDEDDFEYQLEEAGPSKLCAHCGGRLLPNGECPQCGNLLERLDEKFSGDVKHYREVHGDDRQQETELDEYGMPVDPARRKEQIDYLEMEELDDNELPASFYAIAILVLLTLSLAAIGLNDPALACRAAGLLMLLGGGIGLGVGYASMAPQLGGFGAKKFLPLQALAAQFFPGSTEKPPEDKGVMVAKWSLLALLFGVLCVVIAVLLSLAGMEPS